MNIKRIAVTGTFIALALVLSGCSLYKTQSNANPTASENEQKSTSATQSSGIIAYTDSGFSPAEVKVKVGETVTLKNDSSSSVQVNSAPHPQHTQFPELNLGAIAPGESKTVTFTTAGTKKYHNHLNPSQNGTIVVE